MGNLIIPLDGSAPVRQLHLDHFNDQARTDGVGAIIESSPLLARTRLLTVYQRYVQLLPRAIQIWQSLSASEITPADKLLACSDRGRPVAWVSAATHPIAAAMVES